MIHLYMITLLISQSGKKSQKVTSFTEINVNWSSTEKRLKHNLFAATYIVLLKSPHIVMWGLFYVVLNVK